MHHLLPYVLHFLYFLQIKNEIGGMFELSVIGKVSGKKKSKSKKNPQYFIWCGVHFII